MNQKINITIFLIICFFGFIAIAGENIPAEKIKTVDEMYPELATG